MRQTARDLLRYRYLFEQMVRRELRQKYKGSALGVAWYLINPLVLMGVYTLIFTKVLRSPFHIGDYALFVLLGIVVWTFFSQSLLSSATSLLDQGALVRKAVFPREAIPAATVTVQLITFLVLLLLVCLVALPVRGSLDPALLLLPLYLGALYVFTLGLSLVVSIAHAYFRDVSAILGAAILPWFFVTPIFFPPDHFPGSAQHEWLVALLRWANPVAPFIDSIRSVVFAGRGPGWATTAYVLVAAGIALPAGMALFRRLRSELAVVV